MHKQPLDSYDEIPAEMRSYLRHNGWNFNKKACDLAVHGMKKINPATGKKELPQKYDEENSKTLQINYLRGFVRLVHRH